MIEKMNPFGGNWETVLFILIRKLLVRNNPYFFRSELMTTEHLDFAATVLSLLGHKEKPQHPEETAQRTLQNMRNKGYVIFHDNGEYELTLLGYKMMEIMAGRFPYRELKNAIDPLLEPKLV